MKNFYHKPSNAVKVQFEAYNAMPERSKLLSSSLGFASGLNNFVNPKTYSEFYIVPNVIPLAIIPSYKGGPALIKLVSDIITFNHLASVIVVNDSSPAEYDSVFVDIDALSDRVTVLKTPTNFLKAGAINLALTHIKENNIKADVIFTLDDDVQINDYTIGHMASEIMRDERLGAVCSQARAWNKNKNLLTRLQGLEYHGYNVIRKAESGFVNGPLVMHGMLSGFRFEAIMKVGEFATGHLIEDYDMTARIKKAGYDVKFATHAAAWTDVPENFNALWKQRIRWSVGGLEILAKERYLPAIFQDVIGHFMFIATFVSVILAFSIPAENNYPVVTWVIAMVAITQFVIGFTFNLLTLKSYEDADIWDWILRITIIPEFIYANILTVGLLGSYLFIVYTKLVRKLLKLTRHAEYIDKQISLLFLKAGYSMGWGTR
ncbi:MAG: glycosyltransferase family 2 protein [bacterium]|nr:glycosyltransferase family 2 protein [bacterium]